MKIAKIMSKLKTKDKAQKVADSALFNDVTSSEESEARFLLILILLVLLMLINIFIKGSNYFISTMMA